MLSRRMASFVELRDSHTLKIAAKAQGAAGEVRAPVSTIKERNQALNGAVKLVNYAVGRIGAVSANINCDFIDVDDAFR